MTYGERYLDGVLALHHVVHGREFSREMWEWRYRPPSADVVYASVLCGDDGIVGYMGVAPLPGWLDGRDIPFFQIQDLMIHPACRAKHSMAQVHKDSVLSIVERIRERYPLAVVYGFAPRRPLFLYQRFGFASLIEAVPELVVRPAQVRPVEGPFGKMGLEIHEWDWADPNIDHMWQEMKGAIVAGLRRDRAYLRPRYAGHPERQYRLFGIHQRGTAVGWVVVGPLKEGQVLDEVWAPDLLLPPRLVGMALEEIARKLEANTLITWLPSVFAPEFSEIRESGLSALHIPGFPLTTEYLTSNLYYTAGDVGV